MWESEILNFYPWLWWVQMHFKFALILKFKIFYVNLLLLIQTSCFMFGKYQVLAYLYHFKLSSVPNGFKLMQQKSTSYIYIIKKIIEISFKMSFLFHKITSQKTSNILIRKKRILMQILFHLRQVAYGIFI